MKALVDNVNCWWGKALMIYFPPLSTAPCSGKLEQHTERRGVIYSPSWPLNYPPAVNCSWDIQGDRGDMITIRYGLILCGDEGLLCLSETKCEFVSDRSEWGHLSELLSGGRKLKLITVERDCRLGTSHFRSVLLCLISVGYFWHPLSYMQVTCSLFMYLLSQYLCEFHLPLIDEEVENSGIFTHIK